MKLKGSIISVAFIGMMSCTPAVKITDTKPVSMKEEVILILKDQVMQEAEWALTQEPITVTAHSSSRSAGGPHDFFSEGDYWWPDPRSVDSPYIQKDGMTNPDNFVAHRHAMIRFSIIVGALASAYQLTGDEKYFQHALKHCRAWFVDEATKMNPSLLYAQAIRGRFTGRGIGIIDTIHFIEVVQGMRRMEKEKEKGKEDEKEKGKEDEKEKGKEDEKEKGKEKEGEKERIEKELAPIRKWFEQYLQWLTTHKYGRDEMNAENNHGTCWVMQVAAFSKFTGNEELQKFCRNRYKEVLLPSQMATDGSFPREIKRTKPYGYSIFNLDAMTMVCEILSSPSDDLWSFQTTDGKSIRKGIEFLYPYLADKTKWPFSKDVMYWDQWPVAQPALVVGALHFSQKNWLETWKRLDHNPKVEEVIRNLPVRHPIIWINE